MDQYTGTSLEDMVTLDNVGRQMFTIPYSGTYRIEVRGASAQDCTGGGNCWGHSWITNPGGNGALVAANYGFEAGTQLLLMVGQKGYKGWTSCGPGGGGTFVVKCPAGSNTNQCLNNHQLLFAAGGGGGCSTNGGDDGHNYRGHHGLATQSNGESGTWGGGGSGSNGGQYQGGSGYTGDGQSQQYGSNSHSFTNGGRGGVQGEQRGGFGGGGGAHQCKTPPENYHTTISHHLAHVFARERTDGCGFCFSSGCHPGGGGGYAGGGGGNSNYGGGGGSYIWGGHSGGLERTNGENDGQGRVDIVSFSPAECTADWPHC